MLAQHIVLSEVLCDRKAKGQSLTTSCQVTCDHILAIVDRIKAVLLDGEQAFMFSRNQLLG